VSEPSIFFSEVNERQGVFHRRAFLMGGLAGAGLLALGARLAHLQLIEARRYQKLSAGNQFNLPPGLAAARADLDRNGVALASNRPNFRLLVSQGQGLRPGGTLDELAGWCPSTEPAAAPAQGSGPRPEASRWRSWRT
jgi:penicillin-binding protein 2